MFAMYILIVSKRFKRQLGFFLEKHFDMEKIVVEKLNQLKNDPFYPSLKNHKLSGKLKGLSAIFLTYEYRLVFKIVKDKILLLAVGTHDEVY